MPMVFHSRHAGIPVVMEDGQISQKVNEDKEKDNKMPAEITARMEDGDNRLVKVKPAEAVKGEESGSKMSLLDAKPLSILLLWYFFSAITLFLNKYLIVMLKTDTILLGKLGNRKYK
jgi:hypothetical protein